MSNAAEFIQLYNQLDSLLQDRYNDRDRNHSQVMRYSQELEKSVYSKTYERGRKLNMVRVLRNSLVHDLDMNKDEMIAINQATIDFLQSEVRILSNPKRAIDICTPFQKLLAGRPSDKMRDILRAMIAKGNMQAPVLDDKNRVIGVLSPNSIIMYLNANKRAEEGSLVGDLLDFLPLEKHISEHYCFIGRVTPAEEVADLFNDYYKKGKKLVMIFVTEHGLQTEALLGLITPYDVVNLEGD